MPEYSPFNIATQAKNMRDAQKLYFVQISKAKKTRLAGDFAAAAIALKTSKQIEQSFDETIEEILNAK